MISIRPFTRELRKLGFEFCYRDRSGGTTVTEFAARRGDRKVIVQFWACGLYRLTHGTFTKLDNGLEGYRETTLPVTFNSVSEMLAAVEVEWTRPSGPGVVVNGVRP